MNATQRTENLYRYFGWQGGTIHQLEQATGVPASELLHGEADWRDISGRYSQGACANETCGPAMRAELAKMVRGDREFWIGVACSRPTV